LKPSNLGVMEKDTVSFSWDLKLFLTKHKVN
jgi:hypothetical protein